jgi:aerobic carbon-monoxide dehydrogenase medium subunit
MKLPQFEYAAPKTIEEAIALLAASDGGGRPIAGGQSLIPMLAFRVASPSLLVDLRWIPDLADIEISDTGIRLGAKVRWCDIDAHEGLRTGHPLLKAAVGHIAHYQIRNRGTVGGSLAHADPAAELPVLAVTCDAEIVVVGSSGRRTIKAADFFLGPMMTALEAEELIVALHLPPWPSNRRWAFEEYARQRGAFGLAGLALHYDDRGGTAANVQIGVLGASSRIHRLSAAEAIIEGHAVDAQTIEAAAEAAMREVDPAEEVDVPAEYRRALVGTLLERALKASVSRSIGSSDC